MAAACHVPPGTPPFSIATEQAPVIRTSPTTNPSDWLLAIVDVETTGLIPGYHEMIDLGLAITDLDGRVLDSLFVRVQPDHPERTSEGARRINGFDDAKWRRLGALSQNRAVDSIVSFHRRVAGSRPVLMVAFNSQFDAAFMDHLFRARGSSWRNLYHYFVLDIPSMAWALGYRDLSNGGLARRLNVEDEPRVADEHTGITGAMLNVRIYQALRARGMNPIVEISAADSSLVSRILLAEDSRDPSDPALAIGNNHDDLRIRVLAQRAVARIRDATFAARDSFPALSPPHAWPDVPWRSRYRALASLGDDCPAIRSALADSVWAVRLRAADIVTVKCSSDNSLAAILTNWVSSLPADVTRRDSKGVSWHAAAHAVRALSKLRPTEARPLVSRFARHSNWGLRLYAARSAAILRDSALLRQLARDANANVREEAITALSKLTGHSDDVVFISALSANEPQVVRAAALALKGSPRANARTAASAAFERWVLRANASEADVRVALLAAADRPATADRPPTFPPRLPNSATALALGTDIRLRVTMDPRGGGGSFTVKLRGDVAPVMAARVLELADAGYYNGMEWHRVVPDFVIQGGSPVANEYSGYSQYFRDELGTVPHLRGTVGMSTRGHDTGDAQWFVNLSDNLRLGRDYTVFAEIIEGIEVVDDILEGDIIRTIERMKP